MDSTEILLFPFPPTFVKYFMCIPKPADSSTAGSDISKQHQTATFKKIIKQMFPYVQLSLLSDITPFCVNQIKPNQIHVSHIISLVP